MTDLIEFLKKLENIGSAVEYKEAKLVQKTAGRAGLVAVVKDDKIDGVITVEFHFNGSVTMVTLPE